MPHENILAQHTDITPHSVYLPTAMMSNLLQALITAICITLKAEHLSPTAAPPTAPPTSAPPTAGANCAADCAADCGSQLRHRTARKSAFSWPIHELLKESLNLTSSAFAAGQEIQQ